MIGCLSGRSTRSRRETPASVPPRRSSSKVTFRIESERPNRREPRVEHRQALKRRTKPIGLSSQMGFHCRGWPSAADRGSPRSRNSGLERPSRTRRSTSSPSPSWRKQVEDYPLGRVRQAHARVGEDWRMSPCQPRISNRARRAQQLFPIVSTTRSRCARHNMPPGWLSRCFK